MKLAHFADPHLGHRRYHRTADGFRNARELDVAAAFKGCLDAIIQAKPDAVICAGDLFDYHRPSHYAVQAAAAGFQRLRQALPDAPIVLIGGNHDARTLAVENGCVLELFKLFAIDVLSHHQQTISYPALDLSIHGVPYLATHARPCLSPAGSARYRILALHGALKGVSPGRLPEDTLTPSDLAQGWSYTALGDYHVQHQVGPMAWYAGSLDYVSPDIWSELETEAELGHTSKGWLLVDLEARTVERMALPLVRGFIDLKPVQGYGLSAEQLEAAITERLASIDTAGQVVRLIVHDVSRSVEGQLRMLTIRKAHRDAFELKVDVRRPIDAVPVRERLRQKGKMIEEVLDRFLGNRVLPPGVNQGELQALGQTMMAKARDESGSSTEAVA